MITLDHLEAAYEQALPEEMWVQALIPRAYRELSARVVDLPGADPDLVDDVVTEAVLRRVRNPSGETRTESVTSGPFSWSKGVGRDDGPRLGSLFTADEISLIAGSAQRATASFEIAL